MSGGNGSVATAQRKSDFAGKTCGSAGGSPRVRGGRLRRKEMAMNCAQFAEAVHDLERPGTEGFKQRVSALEHAESCARCGLLLEDVTTLNFALDRLAMEDADVQASPAVEMALISEFRKHHAEAVA